MQIRSETYGDLIELHLAGRLDSEWSPTLAAALDDALRQGYHSVTVNLSQVPFVSSAGLAVLISAHKQFKEIRGFFGVGEPSEPVASVIRLSGLSKMLLCDLAEVRSRAGGVLSTVALPSNLVPTDVADFEVYDLEPAVAAEVEIFGDPTRFESGVYDSTGSTEVSFPQDTFGLGLGAFAGQAEGIDPRFGELLIASGSIAQLPAGGSGTPDFQSARAEFVPSARLLYGLRWRAPFAKLVRFDMPDTSRTAPLAGLVGECLNVCRADAAAVVLIAETAGLVGATLRQPPTIGAAPGETRFSHPAVRDWLAFTPERAFTHSLALVVGVAVRGPNPSLAGLQPFLRPLREAGDLLGHFHAAVFPFRPFKKRRIELADTVSTLFDSEQLQGVLHLLNDDRGISGAGDSVFYRGAGWIVPLTGVREGRGQ